MCAQGVGGFENSKSTDFESPDRPSVDVRRGFGTAGFAVRGND